MHAATIASAMLGIELSELLIGLRGCLLHRGQRDDEVAVTRDRHPADGEVLQCARRVHSVVDVGGYVPVAEQIVLGAYIAHESNRSRMDVVAASTTVPASASAPCAIAVSAADVTVAAANSSWWLTAGSESMPM